MPASADYLTKYLTASSKSKTTSNADYDDGSSRPKKRRKKDRSSSALNSGLIVADDDDELLLSSAKNRSKQEEEEDGPMIYDTRVRSAEFRGKKTSNWRSVEDAEADQTRPEDEADKILAEAAADSDRRRRDIEMEDAPTVVDTAQEPDQYSGPRMESGARAGLQTAADTAALAAAEEEAERRAAKKSKSKKSRSDEREAAPEEETIYRDATGRRIDISMRRAEARLAELEKQKREKEERENAMGEVQRQQREERKKDLDEAKFLTIGRTADDEDMNEQLKEVVRWDDPMAEYMAQKRAEEDVAAGRHRSGQKESSTVISKPRKKEYVGAAPPNRYGIKPGWRWDGVDRANGFEKEWFQARGRKARNENLEYQWAMDE